MIEVAAQEIQQVKIRATCPNRRHNLLQFARMQDGSFQSL